MRRFENRSIFVTGAGHGIGRSIAQRLSSEGASIALADIDFEAATRVAKEIVENGGNAFALACDVTDAGSVDSSIVEAIERLGKLDVLVNTAGGDFNEPSFEDITDDLWNQKMDLNLTGTMRCIRAALPHLINSGTGSNVIMIGSVNGTAAFGGFPYSAAKAGLEIMTKNLAARYGRQGVRFNLITPGTIRTRNWDGQEEQLIEFAKMYPLRRIGEPADIAAAAAFLASDDASWITGVNLPVEGGILTGPLNAFTACKSDS
jgi:meso-butanediol dehydrogenase / (S,S)-butanediol dehydrogenase / diacetyl reductase